MSLKSILFVGLTASGACAAPPAPPRPEPPVPIQVAPPPAPEPVSTATAEPAPEPEPELQMTDSGLGIVELTVGTGELAEAGMRVSVHYVGKLEDGRVFESSREGQRPFRFELGSGMVIKGWDEGIVGMRVGGLRRLIIPPQLGYGERGRAPIPPNAILEFEVELLEVEAPSSSAP